MNLGSLVIVAINFLMIFGFMAFKANESSAILELDSFVLTERKQFLESRSIKNNTLEDLNVEIES